MGSYLESPRIVGFAAKVTNFDDATAFRGSLTFNQGNNFMLLIPQSAAPHPTRTYKELQLECFAGYRGMFSI